MRYLTLARAEALEISERRIARLRAGLDQTGQPVARAVVDALQDDVNGKEHWSGEGDEFPDEVLAEARREIEELIYSHPADLSGARKDNIEGKASLVLHRAMSDGGGRRCDA